MGLLLTCEITHPTITVMDERFCSGNGDVLYCEKDQKLRYAIGEGDISDSLVELYYQSH